MFLIDFAEFNRKINIKAYTKIINGKAVPVSSSQRTLLRLKDALTDLRRRGGKTREGGYNFIQQSGKLSGYIPGDSTSVNIPGSKKVIRETLHNHPRNVGFSSTDLFSALKNNEDRIHVVTPNGSWYKARVDSSILDYKDDILHFEKNLHDIFLMEKMVEKKGKFDINDPKQYFNSQVASKYALLQDLNNNNFIDFRAKLSKKDKQIIKYYEPQVNKFLEQNKSYTQRKIDYDDYDDFLEDDDDW